MKRKKTAWILHLEKTKNANPDLSLKEAMKVASGTYKKKK